MTQANDSVLVTPGSGATIATHLAASKEHQVVMIADVTGHVLGTKETWIATTGNTANVAAARTTHVDFFNATGSGKIVRVVGYFLMPTLTAVTGVGLTWELIRTSAVGTGGTAGTARPVDTSNTALPAGITFRTKPTGGATTNYILQYINSSSEETLPYGSLASILNHVCSYPSLHFSGQQPIVIRENEGIKIDQTTNSAIGSTNHMIIFTVE